MLKYICPNCGKEYEATTRMRGISYKDEAGQTHEIEKPTDHCYECEAVAQQAAAEALAKRKHAQ